MIVDGGLGEELQRRGFRYTTALWSGEALLTAPESIAAIHREFLAAGAQIIETATYQLSHATLRKLGYADAAIAELFANAVRLARDAVAAYEAGAGCADSHIVAASLGPFGATVGDGSEYCALQHLERDALYAFHLERTQAVVDAQPDAIIFETIPSQHEALVIAEVARDLGLPSVWISFSCRNGSQTYAGDSIAAAAALLEPFDNVDVIGVNCTAPQVVTPLIHALRQATSKALLVCPNLGQHWESSTRGLAGGDTETLFLRHVPEWLALGVTHIGGCCGVGPSTIAALAAMVPHNEPGSGRRASASAHKVGGGSFTAQSAS